MNLPPKEDSRRKSKRVMVCYLALEPRK